MTFNVRKVSVVKSSVMGAHRSLLAWLLRVKNDTGVFFLDSINQPLAFLTKSEACVRAYSRLDGHNENA